MLGRHQTEAAARRNAAAQLYDLIVRHARDPRFYQDYQVADTPDGRFDMIALHAVLVMRRLHDDPVATLATAQALFDRMFADVDESLREMGVGDLSVGRHVKALAKGFYGRLAAYRDALDAGDDEQLEAALVRNVYRSAAPGTAAVTALAAYVRAVADSLAAFPLAQLLAGRAVFPPLPLPGMAQPGRADAR